MPAPKNTKPTKGGHTGRPSGYKPEFAKQAQKLCELGATDADIANFFEIGTSTLYRWRHDFPDFRDALKRGKEAIDDLVEATLLRRATGYSQNSVKVMQDKGVPLIVPYVEHHAPDTTAMIFWLKNRRPDRWRDRQPEAADEDANKPTPVQVVINVKDGRRDDSGGNA